MISPFAGPVGVGMYYPHPTQSQSNSIPRSNSFSGSLNLGGVGSPLAREVTIPSNGALNGNGSQGFEGDEEGLSSTGLR